MAVRWLFKQHQTVWLWRVLNVDGTIERQSEEFSDFGRAVHDAIRKGFSPSDNRRCEDNRRAEARRLRQLLLLPRLHHPHVRMDRLRAVDNHLQIGRD